MTRRTSGIAMSPKIVVILAIGTFVLLKLGSPLGLLGFGLLLHRFPAVLAGLFILVGVLALFPSQIPAALTRTPFAVRRG
jgi:hypothetical protein